MAARPLLLLEERLWFGVLSFPFRNANKVIATERFLDSDVDDDDECADTLV
jgi:hypothetical protein